MARITKARLEWQLKTATQLGGYAKGPYPTPGQLVINHSASGYSIDLVANKAGAQANVSPECLTAKELDLWLQGFNRGLDSERGKAQLKVWQHEN